MNSNSALAYEVDSSKILALNTLGASCSESILRRIVPGVFIASYEGSREAVRYNSSEGVVVLLQSYNGRVGLLVRV